MLAKLEEFDIPPFLLHWVTDFLSSRSQRVKLGDILSSELEIWGTVPQGTKLGVLLFLLMINDLRTEVPTYKYVDDTTLYRVSNDPCDTKLQDSVNTVVAWSKSNYMKLNTTKTKEMLITFSRPPPKVPSITVEGVPLERVDCVTLLGVKLSADLTWHSHVQYIISKAQSRLFSLNLLRRAKVAPKDIVQVYCSKVRPVIEYAAPVWHSSLSKELSDNLEDLQIRALRIAYPMLSYEQSLLESGLPSLSERRTSLCKMFFDKIQNPQDKLHRILPEKKDNPQNTRSGRKYPLPKTHTKRYKDSFLPFALYNLQ